MSVYSSWKGSLADGDTVVSKPFISDSSVDSVIITNKGITSVLINLYLQTTDEGSSRIRLSPVNLQLEAGASYRDEKIVVLSRERLAVSVSGGNVDYYFSVISEK